MGEDTMQYFMDTMDNMKRLKYFQMVSALANIITLVLFISLLSLVKIFKQVIHTVLGVIKNFLLIGYMVYNILSSFESIRITNDLRSFIESFWSRRCIDVFTENAFIRYEVVDYFKEIDKFNGYLYIFSYLYGGVTFLQFLRYLYKAYIRFKNRYRRKIAREELGDLIDKNKILLEHNKSASEIKKV
jgi:hypothetical protein